MDALESLMRPVARLLNRNISDSIEARQLCERMNGRAVGVEVRDTGLSVFFVMEDGGVRLVTTLERDADATITGSIPGLVQLAAGGSEDVIRGGSVKLSGDATTAQSFQKLLKLAKPDPEEELSGIVGDTLAHRAGELARSFGAWGRDARDTLGENLREYLQHEGRQLPSRYDIEMFTDAVNELRDDVDRMEARIDRLKSRREDKNG